jgi:hypothetical protein
MSGKRPILWKKMWIICRDIPNKFPFTPLPAALAFWYAT